MLYLTEKNIGGIVCVKNLGVGKSRVRYITRGARQLKRVQPWPPRSFIESEWISKAGFLVFFKVNRWRCGFRLRTERETSGRTQGRILSNLDDFSCFLHFRFLLVLVLDFAWQDHKFSKKIHLLNKSKLV